MACQPAETTGAASSTLLQMPTQASQIWTLGPAMRRVTSLSDLPQKEHLSFLRRLSAIMAAASCQGGLDTSSAPSVRQGHLDIDRYSGPAAARLPWSCRRVDCYVGLTMEAARCCAGADIARQSSAAMGRFHVGMVGRGG